MRRALGAHIGYMVVPMLSHRASRSVAVGFRPFVAVAPLLLGVACSGAEADGLPEFSGAFGSGAGGSTSAQPPGVGSSTTPNAPSTPTGVSGSGGTEGTNPSNVGLTPNQSSGSQAGAAQSPGAGGATMAPTTPTGEGGAAGSAATGSAGSAAVGSAGANGMPPAMQPPPPPANQPPPAPNPTPLPPNDGCPGQFLCDGFESVSAGSAPDPEIWAVMQEYSIRAQPTNALVSNANAHSGTQAVRVTASGRDGIIASLPQSSYYMRAWLQLDAVPQGPVLVGLGSDPNNEVRLRLWSPGWATINMIPGDAIRPAGATAGNCPNCVTLAANRWFCAEFFIDNAARSATLWIDGVEAAAVVNGDGGWATQPASPQMFIGSMALQGGQTGVWIDDVAAGPERIGCD